MRLSRISLQNFRNYQRNEVSFNSDLVLVLGDNATGKTNFLESIYYLSRLKSFRAPDSLLPTFGQEFFSLEAETDNGNKFEAVSQISPTKKRQLKINGQKTEGGLWQSFATVLFVPNDLNLFILGPIFRRKFLDEILSQSDSEYAIDLVSLDHILKQKAALLEQIFSSNAGYDQIDFWNQQLIPISLRVTQKRLELVKFFNSKLNQILQGLTGFVDRHEIIYKSIEQLTEEALAEKLESIKSAEIRSGKNLIGPHRDDFSFLKNEQPNIFNSSRGELRAQIIALKLLQAEYLEIKRDKPVILLDDVFSELDETRRTKLIESLSGYQIIITSTEEHHLPNLSKEHQVLHVENNKIS